MPWSFPLENVNRRRKKGGRQQSPPKFSRGCDEKKIRISSHIRKAGWHVVKIAKYCLLLVNNTGEVLVRVKWQEGKRKEKENNTVAGPCWKKLKGKNELHWMQKLGENFWGKEKLSLTIALIPSCFTIIILWHWGNPLNRALTLSTTSNNEYCIKLLYRKRQHPTRNQRKVPLKKLCRFLFILYLFTCCCFVLFFN